MKINKRLIDKKVVREYLISFCQALLLLFVMYVVFWPVKIEGDSMEPELYDGERIIMSRILGLFGDFKRGDIVICKNPLKSREGHVVKRIVAVPGDSIQVSGKNVYLNGELLEEDYAIGKTFGDADLKLLDGEYFIMGDNREISVDSRNYGAVGKAQISGKVVIKWLPINKLKIY